MISSAIDSWGSGVVYKEDKGRKPTRGLNTYMDNDLRLVKYINDKKQIDVHDWNETFEESQVVSTRWFNLVCSGERVTDILNKLSKENKNSLSFGNLFLVIVTTKTYGI